ncbi:MAG: hypothetical protein N2512_08600, partial [Armatimonadetes bacterium]|nr:hypothetical protein [Armatimonadota bacterium]
PRHASKVHLASYGDGRFRLQGLGLPDWTQEGGEVFFTCWGSVGDRRTDAVAAWEIILPWRERERGLAGLAAHPIRPDPWRDRESRGSGKPGSFSRPS